MPVAPVAYGGNAAAQSTPKQTTAQPTSATPVARPATPPSETPTQWAGQVASDLGINPTTDPNAITDILSWMPNEEPTSQWWGGFGSAASPTRINPLNTGLQAYGYTGDPLTGNVLSSGLGTYPTLSAAAQAEAATLKEAPYANVLSDLQQGVSPSVFQQALAGTGYAGSHYAGDTFSSAGAGGETRGPAVTGGSVGPGTPSATLSPQQTSAINSAVAAYAKQNGLNAQQSSQLTQVLSSVLQSQMEGSIIGQQQSTDQLGYTAQQYANTQSQAQQQYGFEQQQLGIQGEQLGISQRGLTQEQGYLGQQAGFAKEAYGRSMAGLENQMQNLIAGYGFQQQQQQLSRQQTESGLAASGTYNTGSRTLAEQQLGLTAAEEAQQFKYSQTGINLSEQATQRGYVQQKDSFAYQQQQVSNALASLDTQFQQLGLSKQEAYAGLQNALTNAGLQNVMSVDQLATSLAMQQAGMSSPIGSIIGTLVQASPMIGALVGQ